MSASARPVLARVSSSAGERVETVDARMPVLMRCVLGFSALAIIWIDPAEPTRAGFQLDKVQRGLDPDDWKPMKSVGPGVREKEAVPMSKRRFESIWDAIEDSAQDAAGMRARADLMLQLQEHLRKRGLTQTEAARLLKVAQPRVSDLMRGRIDLFSADMLIEMLGRLGARVTVRVEFKRAA